MLSREQQGFTLIELLVAVAILGILFTVAIPQYRNYTFRVDRSSDGGAALNHIMQAQERHYAENQTYVTDLTILGYGLAANLPSPDGNYQITAAACEDLTIAQCVVLTATAQGPQVNDPNGNNGNISLNSQGIRTGW